MNNANHYYICFQPRSGSTYLAELLNNPDKGVVNASELITRNSSLELSLTSLEELKLNGFSPGLKKEITDRYFLSTREMKNSGFKFSYYQIADDAPGFIQHLTQTEAKGIFLYRENIVDTAISQIWSLHRSLQGKLPCLTNDEPNNITRIKPVEQAFNYYLVDSYMQREMVKCLHCIPSPDKTLLVSYEELLGEASKDELILRICKFLGIDPSELSETRQKKVQASSTNLIEADTLQEMIARAKIYRFMQ